MTRPFHPFVAQIKRNFRRAVSCVRNQKKLLAQFALQLVTHVFQRSRRTLPSAHSVAWIVSLEMISSGAQQIRVQGDAAHSKSNQYRHRCAQSQRNTVFEPFPPEVQRQKAEAEKSKSIPIRRSGFVH